MTSQKLSTLTIVLRFPKTPKKAMERNLYRDKFRSWIEQERKNLPFDEMKSSKNLITLKSPNFLFGVDFGKTFEIVLGVKESEENLEKMNESANKIISFLNTIMPQVVTTIEGRSQITKESKKAKDLARKIIGEQRIAKMMEITKVPWNPIGIFLTWKSDSRTNFAASASYEDQHVVLSSSVLTWQNNIPLDAVRKEYQELLKFEEIISKIMKEEF